ncbi:MAG: hypothetical protein J6P53_02185, partial [Mailhella sp.]|nr:hypothetical protein [Mailhella sp.]
MDGPGIEERRAMFPRGLEQPPGSYRFGADALALAGMTAELPLAGNAALCELGTGCGAAALAVLLSVAVLAADPVISIDFADGAGDVELVNAEIVEDVTRGSVLKV